jgi:hypothetical protein
MGGHAVTDRELLEKAAKAAGYDVGYWMESVSVNDNITVTGFILRGKVWNPLTSDSDAFRLMVDLLLGVAVFDCHVCTESIENNKLLSCCPIENNDPHAATRRAIVLAAAAMVDTGVGEDV